jgi:hypothetical protein
VRLFVPCVVPSLRRSFLALLRMANNALMNNGLQQRSKIHPAAGPADTVVRTLDNKLPLTPENKYKNSLRPLLSCLSVFIIVIGSLWAIQAYFFPLSAPYELPKHSQQLAYFLISYTVIMVTMRFIECGSYILYETPWCCNLAMILCSLGILLNNNLLIAASFVGISMDQLMWYVDCIGYLIIGKFPVGAAKYLIWPQTSFTKKITCTHHLWFLPLNLYLLQFQFPDNSFILGCLFTALATCSCRFLTPFEILDPVDPNVVHYLNINCGYQFWRDVKIKFLHKGNHLPWFLWLPSFVVWGNLLLNGPGFAFFLAVCKFSNKAA